MYREEYVPDNYDQYKRHEAEQCREEERLPRCSMCGHKIYEDKCWRFSDEVICDSCAEEHFRIDTEDLIE